MGARFWRTVGQDLVATATATATATAAATAAAAATVGLDADPFAMVVPVVAVDVATEVEDSIRARSAADDIRTTVAVKPEDVSAGTTGAGIGTTTGSQLVSPGTATKAIDALLAS